MNWYRQPDRREGLEYFILLPGLVIITLISGGGSACLDTALSQQVKS